MVQYNVTGMSCAACATRVEKAVSAVAGVESCAVNLLTNSMGVEGDVSPEQVIAAVTKAGYGASMKGKGAKKAVEEADALEDTETPRLRKRLASSAVFLLLLMYLSMGHMMWGWPLPEFLEGNHIAMGIIELLLTIIIMGINQRFFISGYRALWHRAPNMDTLVAIGASAAFLWSVWALFAMTDAQLHGDTAAVEDWMMQLYFESAAMILTLITVGKTLEAYSKGRTTDALKSLMKLAPKSAAVERDGKEVAIPVEEVRAGDVFVVRPGESIPVDGTILEGTSAIDEAALTGESIPVDKEPGDQVSAGTINQSGFLRCKATRVGEDTTLSQIIRMVGEAAATKAPIAKIADKVSAIFVPAVMGIAVLTFVIWLLIGQTAGFALARGISVLVISCPCALGLATPVAIMVGSGVGARNGILFKTAASLEVAGRVKTVALDKTGTITRGTPTVTDILPADGVTERELLTIALALELPSEHPLAKAVVTLGAERGIIAPQVEKFTVLPGSGVSARLEETTLMGGNEKLIRANSVLLSETEALADQLSEQGKTPLFFLRGGRLLGILAVADVLKEDSCDAIQEMKDIGLNVVMLTGDNRRTATTIGEAAGVDEVLADLKPKDKDMAISDLRTRDGGVNVCMVGDGINDAPALTRADLGIAIGAGTDVAIDAADVVLMKNELSGVPTAIRLSRATLRNIRQNLFWAFIYNIIGIPLAAGVLIPFGLALSPGFGALAMSLSSFCVVMNALRLNLFRVKRKEKKDEKTEQEEETKVMSTQPTSTLRIEGMMCEHCEQHVKEALNAVPGVNVLSISHETGSAEITKAPEVTDAQLAEAVKGAGYALVS